MKTILYLHHVSSIGGASYCLLNILKEIDRTKYKPIVLLKGYGPLVDEIKKLNIEVLTMFSMATIPYNRSFFRIKTILNYFKVLLSLTKFRILLSKLDIDLVYLNNMMLYPYLKVAKKLNLKTIIHIREHWPLDEHTIQLSLAQDFIYKFADSVIVINNYSSMMFPKAKEKTSIVYDWINFDDRYEYRPFNKIFNEDSSKLKVFLYTGGMQKIKGAYEVVTSFTNHLIKTDYRLLIVGVDSKINTEGLKGKIKFILSKVGYKTYEYKVKKAIHKDARIKCIPATFALKHIIEQSYCTLSYFKMPHANLALAESIILGTVPLAATTPESLEYSDNGNLAILFGLLNFNEFLEKLQNIDTEYEVVKYRIDKMKFIIARLFDRRRNVELLSETYRKCLSE